MNDDRDRIDLATEERLRRAVRFRDAEVTTSPDALSRIRERATQRTRAGRWQRSGLLVAAAAALVLVIGGLTFVLAGDDDSPDVATDTTSDGAPADDSSGAPGPADETDPPGSTLLPATTTLPPSTTTASPIVRLTPEERALLGLIVWPLDSRSFQDPTTLAFSYATQALGIADPVMETTTDDRSAVVTIAQIGEDGQPFGEATRLELVAIDDFNWAIVEAHSEEVRIDSIAIVDDGLATVTGTGRSFEGAARIVTRSVCDPEGVITPVMVGGGPEYASFTQLVAFVSCPDFPVVVELATEEVLEDGVPSVAAVAHHEDPLDLAWSVMRVEPEDVLNVRSGPGVQNEIVATLAPDATGIEMISRQSELVNGEPWREIRTPDGVTGWVNFSYLTAQATPDPATGVLAVDLLQQLADRETDPWTPAIGERGLWIGGIGVFADAPTPFTHVTVDEMSSGTSLDFNPFPSEPCDRECELSAADFVIGPASFADDIADRLPGLVATDVVQSIDSDEQFLYGPLDQLDLFDPLHSVTVEIPPTDEFGELDWRRYHLWFDWSDGRPRVIALWRWGWTP